MSAVRGQGGQAGQERALVAFRAVAGAALVLAPGFGARVWLGSSAPWARRLTRTIGARDLVLCAGLLTSGGRALDRWRGAAALADLGDGVLATARGVTARHPASMMIAATAFAASWAERPRTPSATS